MKKISILGSTGSIGKNCLNVIQALNGQFSVQYLTANRNVAALYEQARLFRPAAVAVLDAEQVAPFEQKFRELGVELMVGQDGLLEISAKSDVDIVVNALVGAAGLLPTLNAIQKNRRIALANKETLVIGGELVMQKARDLQAEIIPIDSEHSAILQCLAGEASNGIRYLILTASGGPFRELDKREFVSVTVEQALDHPNWDMGRKITIDSATLMNKGLEVIEAHWLFGVDSSKIDVVIHPQSIVHSMVEFEDGSIKAQLGLPDMRVPIQYALTFPARMPAEFPRLQFNQLQNLSFEQPDTDKFRCLHLSFEALRNGGATPAVLNAANEEAVNLFLEREISFDQIPAIVSEALCDIHQNSFSSVEELLNYDRTTREYVQNRFG